MLYLERAPGYFVEWNGEPINEVRHPPNIGALWTAEDLADKGLFDPVDPPIPEGKEVTKRTVARVNGVVTFVYEWVSVPLPDLNRIQFEFMVEKLGLNQAIETALDAMPSKTEPEQNAKILAKVLYRSGQRFERSHYLFTTLADAVGLTSQMVDAAWTQALLI